MNQRALDKIVAQVLTGRLVETLEVGSSIRELYRNEAITGETLLILGGLRLGSRG